MDQQQQLVNDRSLVDSVSVLLDVIRRFRRFPGLNKHGPLAVLLCFLSSSISDLMRLYIGNLYMCHCQLCTIVGQPNIAVNSVELHVLPLVPKNEILWVCLPHIMDLLPK
jgi:hypothetical protein